MTATTERPVRKAAARKPLTGEETIVEVSESVEVLLSERDALLAQVAALRGDIVIIGEGMANEAAANGRSYCEAYEQCVQNVSEQMEDPAAAQSFKESGIRKWYRFRVMVSEEVEVQVRSGSEVAARAELRRSPTSYINRHDITYSLIDDDEQIVLVSATPVTY